MNEMDRDQREQLFKINIYNYPLSELKTLKTTLLELKSKLERCNDKKNIGTPSVRHILNKKRSI